MNDELLWELQRTNHELERVNVNLRALTEAVITASHEASGREFPADLTADEITESAERRVSEERTAWNRERFGIDADEDGDDDE